jgi:fatty-acyl-CoA synthase
VIAVPHARWVERPLAIVVQRDPSVTTDELREHLTARVARWSIPDSFEIAETSPRPPSERSTKVTLRKQHATTRHQPEPAA